MKQLRVAAEKGNAGAQFNLGIMYDRELGDDGHFSRENRAEAIKWLSMSARQGLPRAQSKLAEVYASEPAERGDQVKACAWYLVAMTGVSGIHLNRAEAEYDRVASRLRPGQIMTAKRNARAFIEALPS